MCPLPSRLWVWGGTRGPPAGFGRSPGRKRVLVHLELERTCLMAIKVCIFCDAYLWLCICTYITSIIFIIVFLIHEWLGLLILICQPGFNASSTSVYDKTTANSIKAKKYFCKKQWLFYRLKVISLTLSLQLADAHSFVFRHYGPRYIK